MEIVDLIFDDAKTNLFTIMMYFFTEIFNIIGR